MGKKTVIYRKQDDEDQRISRVYITEEGRKICKKSIKVMEKLEEECFEDFTVEEKVLLRRLFLQMKDNLLVATDVEKSR